MKNFAIWWLQKITPMYFFANYREKETYQIQLDAMRANARCGAWPGTY